MPSFFSSPTSVMPGVPAGTTKALMPPRPALLSTVAHTTTKPPSAVDAPSPPVQKIFVPFEHPLVAVEPRRRLDRRRVGARARLGDRHRAPGRRPVALEHGQEARLLLLRAGRRHRGAAERPRRACAGRGRRRPSRAPRPACRPAPCRRPAPATSGPPFAALAPVPVHPLARQVRARGRRTSARSVACGRAPWRGSDRALRARRRSARRRSACLVLLLDQRQRFEAGEAARVPEHAARAGSRGCSRGRRAPAPRRRPRRARSRRTWSSASVASRSASSPWSRRQAASQASSRAPSISIAISASRKAIACFCAILLPNASRSLA